MTANPLESRLAGYAYLCSTLGLVGMPHWHTSFVSSSGTRRSKILEGVMEDIFPKKYWPGDKAGDHLEFALKYDGVNLGLLTRIFEHLPQEELTQYIKSRPTGKYARRIWFFYEFLTGEHLPINDAASGNYVDALDTKENFVIENGDRSPRHRIVNNLLGPPSFCPMIRKTEKLAKLDSFEIRKSCEEIVSAYSPDLLRRALNYLYHKETKSSFEIEHVKPNASRTGKFVSSLMLAEKEDFCEKDRLIELQNRIVDLRFEESDYRNSQNYVGESVAYQREIVHFVCPRPVDLPSLMSGLIESHKRMLAGNILPIIHAAAIAYGFVFLHPFEDGNGRIHRFLVHNILSLREMVPRDLMFPVSAVMLKNLADYDASLEVFSRPLLQLVDYRLDHVGQMTVTNDTACWYKYMDMTPQAEALYEFIAKTIKEELVDELGFLDNYDNTKRAIQNIIDMPDRRIDLFIQLCTQNNGRLSARKRLAHFDFLRDDELAAMEQAIKENGNRPA